MRGHSTVLGGEQQIRPRPAVRRRAVVLGWANVLVGIWVFLTPFLGGGSSFVLWSNGISGVFSAIVAVWAGPDTPFHSWGAGVSGVSLLLLSFLHDSPSFGPSPWTNLLLGSFIALSGLVGAVRARARGS